MDSTEQTIRRLRDEGLSWDKIGQLTGLSAYRAQCLVDPEFAEMRRARDRRRNRKLERSRQALDVHLTEPGHFTPAEIARIVSTVPRDTRDRITRFLGDPLPGRSALDRRQAA